MHTSIKDSHLSQLNLNYLVQGNYVIWQMVSHFTGLLCMTAGSTALTTIPFCLQVTSHTFYVIMLQLILCFHVPYVKKVLEKVFFSSQMCITVTKNAHCTLMFCWWNWRYCTLKAFFQITFNAEMFTMWSLSFNMPTSKNWLLFCHQKHSGDNWKNCIVSCWTVLLREDMIFHKQVFRKWCQTVC